MPSIYYLLSSNESLSAKSEITHYRTYVITLLQFAQFAQSSFSNFWCFFEFSENALENWRKFKNTKENTWKSKN